MLECWQGTLSKIIRNTYRAWVRAREQVLSVPNEPHENFRSNTRTGAPAREGRHVKFWQVTTKGRRKSPKQARFAIDFD
jgi:hypothetical protein